MAIPTIDNFTEYLQSNPIQRTNRFRVTVSFPGQSEVSFFAESVTLPGRSLATVERRTMGKVSQKDFPYEQLYSGDLDMSIVMTQDGGERKYFEDWMNFIINENGSIRINRDDYAGTMEIQLLGGGEESSSGMTVREVFPKSIGTVTMSNTEENAYGILPIGLSFKDYTWNTEERPPNADTIH